MISWAAAADDATRLEPSWWKFPIIGSFRGDGGIFILFLESNEIHLTQIKITTMRHDNKVRRRVCKDEKFSMI
ncbi:hypothetical protein HanIR_Chr04g0160321 [Helianthus annuus]|nr:hypothetical protein HanIR_Chr04g0160321 [Helianthus annuus]